MANRKVLSAKLHQAYHVANIGEFYIFPPSNKVLDNLSMEVDSGANLEVSFVNKGSAMKILIPAANVAGMQLEVTAKKSS